MTVTFKPFFKLFILLDLECPKHLQNNLFYDWKHHLKMFGLGGAIKPGEEEGDRFTKINRE